MSSVGGDPTAITPDANLQATAGQGIACVLLDPRTSLVDCLEAMLIIELTDQDMWSMLARTAEPLGDASMIEKITQAQNRPNRPPAPRRSPRAARSACSGRSR